MLYPDRLQIVIYNAYTDKNKNIKKKFLKNLSKAISNLLQAHLVDIWIYVFKHMFRFINKPMAFGRTKLKRSASCGTEQDHRTDWAS